MLCVCVYVCVCVGGEGKERNTRVGRLLSASLACSRPAAMQDLAYWSLPTRSPLQVVCVSYIRLCMYVHVHVGANACSLWFVMSWSYLPSHVLSQSSGE